MARAPASPAADARLRAVTLAGWRQFGDVRIDLHDTLTILTGANGAGKTTILNLLASHFGWSVPLATTPSKNPLSRAIEFLTSGWLWGKAASMSGGPDIVVGRVDYDSGSTDILIPRTTEQHSFTARFRDAKPVRGLYIPSHRPVFVPTQVKPQAGVTPAAAFTRYSDAVRSAWTPGMRSAETPLEAMKSTLLGWLVGSESALASGFADALRIVLPSPLGFETLVERSGEILLITRTGEFTIDAVSGGIAALIDLTWQIYTYSADASGAFVVLIDEPENHLHPELQRSVLHQFTRAFPQAQFVVASHAPLVVTSVREANVYALVYRDLREHPMADQPPPEEQQRWIVEAEQLSRFDRAGTANQVLRDVLGLDYTMPVWAANIMDEAVNDVAQHGYSSEALTTFEVRLKENGLEAYVPQGIASIAERANTAPEAAI